MGVAGERMSLWPYLKDYNGLSVGRSGPSGAQVWDVALASESLREQSGAEDIAFRVQGSGL